MDPPKVIAIVDLGYLKSVNAWLDMAHSLLSASKRHQWLGVQLRSKGAIDPAILLPVLKVPSLSNHYWMLSSLSWSSSSCALPRIKRLRVQSHFHDPFMVLKTFENTISYHIGFNLHRSFINTQAGMPLGHQTQEVIELNGHPIVAVGGITRKCTSVADAGAAGVGALEHLC